MAEVGQAEVPVFPTFQGFRRAVVSEVDSSATEASRSFGDKFSSGLGSAVRGVGVVIGAGLVAAGAGVGAVIGTALSKGLDRALNIQDARAQLTGLGHDAASVDTIMGNALTSVRGTAFGLDAAATVAASAVAAGIAPGRELERTLGLVADAAATARVPLGEMGSIVNKVASSGRLTTDVLNQFHDRGVPLLQMVAGEYGVTAEAAQEMVTRGEVDFARFQSALENNVGGAALASGNTARGAWANVQAALGRLGAMFTGGAVAGAPALFQSMSGAIDRAAAALTPLAERLNTWIGPAMAQLAGWIDRIDFSVIAEQVGSLFSGVDFSSAGAAVGSIGSAFAQVSPFLTQVWGGLQSVGGALGGVFAAGLRAAEPLLNLFADGLTWVADNGDMLPGIIMGVVGAFIAYRASQMAANIAQLAAIPAAYGNVAAQFALAAAQRATGASTAVNTGLQVAQRGAFLGSTATVLASTAAMVAQRVAMVAGAVATGVATAAQWAMNAAMSANPIMLVVLAVAALVAGLIWFFTQTELGQQVWANFTQFLGEAWANVSAWFMAVGNGLAAWWNGLWAGISAWASATWNGIVGFITAYVSVLRNMIMFAFNAVRVWWDGLWSGISNFVMGIWNGIVGFIAAYISVVRNTITVTLNNIRSTWSNIWNGIAAFISTAWSNIASGVSTGIGNVISFVSGLPSRVLSALGNIGGLLLNSGKSLIQGFINGIQSMIGAVGNAIGGVMDFIGGFFPSSPAKRGRFAGSGWTDLKQSGAALFEQFASGASGQVELDAAVRGAGAAGGSSAAAVVATGSSQPIYTDMGELVGWIKRLASGEARLVWALADENDSFDHRLGVR